MKYFKIPPAAACVIALTSVTCFAQDRRDFEEMDTTSRREVVHSQAGSVSENQVKIELEKKIGGIYLVEVKLGDETKEVLIDAHTGKILREREIPRKA
jgi:uncharacterized membrane protein YkoI